MANVELLVQTLEKIEANPLQWWQPAWRTDMEHETDDRCGTAMCFAGWACEIAGGTWLTAASHEYSDVLAVTADDRPGDVDHWEGIGRGATAHMRAQRLLGINGSQSCELFASNNTLDTLRACVNALIENPDADLNAIVTRNGAA